MKTTTCFAIWFSLSLLLVGSLSANQVDEDLKEIGTLRGIIAVLDLPAGEFDHIVELVNKSELLVYFQSADADQVNLVRQAADSSGLLGRRIFVDSGALESIHLADNLADGILVAATADEETTDSELLRVLRPRATALVGDRKLVKPVPAGIDEWTHPYHGPDNNPQSTDQLAKGTFRTQFLAAPKFSPMPEQTVVAGGRIFKAMGHIAHKANQNEMLNTLLCINAYNGTILWKRPLPAGFMIHRNTMVATADALFMGDDQSCKIIDAATGEVRGEITVPEDITDGPVWKWMALREDVLYALVGNPEITVDTQKSARRGLGHWPWGMWKGHDYKDPRTSFGFGRTLVAIDIATHRVLWNYRDEEFLDARGVCMNDGQIFCFSPDRFLACINAADGTLLWKNADSDLLAYIGPNEKAQHYVTGYATTCYMKCNDQYVFFAGPQRNRLVVASAQNGKLAWTQPHGNLQLVLREDAIYAAGPNTTGQRLDYATGELLSSLPTRRACTRATGCIDSIFYRTSGGTVRVMTEDNSAEHISPMRPPCQDGVIISNGHLYWGPWMCGCQLSLYGHIGLAPVGTTEESSSDIYASARWVGDRLDDVKPLNIQDRDWTTYRGDNARTDVGQVEIPANVELAWKAEASNGELPTAPVAAGGLVFIADRTGAVRAFDRDGKESWKAYTGGAIYYPPAVADDRLYVGSADGRVYAFEAVTGRPLWTFRVAPAERMLPVYNKLISTWPVAGGVVVANGTVYAAAGIVHYDGTYVVALDGATGELKARNSTSGVVSDEVNNGISLQGELMIADGELRFLAGGVYETARYDLATLECRNEPKVQLNSEFRTAFYPLYPAYGKYVSLDHTLADGSTLTHDASYEGSHFTNLALQAPLPAGVPKEKKEAARWYRRRGGKMPETIWQDKSDRRFTSFVVSGDTLLVSGHTDSAPDEFFLATINVRNGADGWRQELPADTVKGGTAIDRDGRILVALENGQLWCFAPRETGLR